VPVPAVGRHRRPPIIVVVVAKDDRVVGIDLFAPRRLPSQKVCDAFGLDRVMPADQLPPEAHFANEGSRARCWNLQPRSCCSKWRIRTDCSESDGSASSATGRWPQVDGQRGTAPRLRRVSRSRTAVPSSGRSRACVRTGTSCTQRACSCATGSARCGGRRCSGCRSAPSWTGPESRCCRIATGWTSRGHTRGRSRGACSLACPCPGRRSRGRLFLKPSTADERRKLSVPRVDEKKAGRKPK